MFDERSADEPATDPKKVFQIDVLYFALDTIDMQLTQLFSNHIEVLSAFLCLSPESIHKRSFQENKACLDNILAEYGPNGSGDIDDSVIQEYEIFQRRCIDSLPIEVPILKRVIMKKKKWKKTRGKCKSPRHVFQFLYESKLERVFPNLYKLYQLFLTIPVTSAEAKRLFSKLKMIETYQRSKMTQARTNNLALLSIEKPPEISVGIFSFHSGIF